MQSWLTNVANPSFWLFDLDKNGDHLFENILTMFISKINHSSKTIQLQSSLLSFLWLSVIVLLISLNLKQKQIV